MLPSTTTTKSKSNFYSVAFEDIDFSDPALLNRPAHKVRRTPLIGTIGNPNITNVELQMMMEAGMNMARIQISQTTTQEKIRLIDNIVEAAAECSKKHRVAHWPMGTCIALKTCNVKTGLLEVDQPFITIAEGSSVILTRKLTEFDKCNEKTIFVDNQYLTTDVKVGMEVSINVEEIVMRVTEIVDDDSIKCNVEKTGRLCNMSNVSVRGIKYSRPLITNQDLKLVQFTLDNQIDVLIVPHARHPDTIRKIKAYIGNRRRPLIFFGVSGTSGLVNFDDLLKECDGVILAREFLAYELEPWRKYKLSLIQKLLTAKSLKAGKPMFLSGGFCDTLLKDHTTAHDISDVTNALLDGVAGFVLGECGDTEYAVQALKTVSDICSSVEPLLATKSKFWRLIDEIKAPANASEACIIACATVATYVQADVIILPTVTGETAKALIRIRPPALIIAVSKDIRISRMLHIYPCCLSLLYKEKEHFASWEETVEHRIQFAVEHAVQRGWLMYGDLYVTLQKHKYTSCFCDKVSIWMTSVQKNSFFECPEEIETRKLGKSVVDLPKINKPVEIYFIFYLVVTKSDSCNVSFKARCVDYLVINKNNFYFLLDKEMDFTIKQVKKCPTKLD